MNVRFHFVLTFDNDPWCRWREQLNKRSCEGTICFATPSKTFHRPEKPIKLEILFLACPLIVELSIMIVSIQYQVRPPLSTRENHENVTNVETGLPRTHMMIDSLNVTTSNLRRYTTLQISWQHNGATGLSR